MRELSGSPVSRAHRRKPVAAGIAAIGVLSGPALCSAANVLYVTNCLDDGSLYTLRQSVLSAATGDTVDLSLLNAASPGCATATPPGTININAGGAIAIPAANTQLYIVGPTNYSVTVSSAPASPAGNPTRIFDMPGGGSLGVSNLTLAHGGIVRALAAYGGCIHSTGALSLQNVTMTDCLANSTGDAGGFGGAIVATDVHIMHSTITGSTASGGVTYGGAVLCTTCDIRYSTFSGNSATYGAAIFVGASADIENSTISGNTSVDYGALACYGNCTVVNSTISGNSAAGGPTAGMFVAGTAAPTTRIYNSTIAFNSASSAEKGLAPGLAIAGGSVKVYSTIISNNTYGGSTNFDFSINSGVTLSAGNDMVPYPPSSGMPSGSNTLPGVCPLLLPLSYNGGPTRTHALPSHSPAIDAGSNVFLPTPSYDQRGSPFARMSGSAPDIGAYEVDQSDVVFNTGFEGCP